MKLKQEIQEAADRFCVTPTTVRRHDYYIVNKNW